MTNHTISQIIVYMLGHDRATSSIRSPRAEDPSIYWIPQGLYPTNNSHIWHSRVGRALLHWRKECGRLWVLLGNAAQAPINHVANVYWFLLISTSDIKRCNNLYLFLFFIYFFTAEDNHLRKSTVLSSGTCRYTGHQQSLHQPKFDQVCPKI